MSVHADFPTVRLQIMTACTNNDYSHFYSFFGEREHESRVHSKGRNHEEKKKKKRKKSAYSNLHSFNHINIVVSSVQLKEELRVANSSD